MFDLAGAVIMDVLGIAIFAGTWVFVIGMAVGVVWTAAHWMWEQCVPPYQGLVFPPERLINSFGDWMFATARRARRYFQ